MSKKHTVIMNNSFVSNLKLTVRLKQYSNGGTAIILDNDAYDDRYCVASIWIQNACQEGEVAIKDWSENEGVMKALMDGGIIGPKKTSIQCGFAEATIHDLLIED